MDVLARIRGFPVGEGLDVDIHAGQTMRVAGENGAGKTSLLRVLAGLSSPLVPREADITPQTSIVFQSARDGLIGLTVRGEHRIRGLAVPDRRDLDRDIATLSQGEARRLALDIAESEDAALLLLDEPTEGLDDEAVATLRRRIEARRGATVVVDHQGRLADLCDTTVVLGADESSGWPRLPHVQGPVVLDAPAATVQRGAAAVACPVWHGTPGLHVVQGPNGCGKSTWLLALAGMVPGLEARVRGRRVRPGSNVRLLLPGVRDHAHEQRVADGLDGIDPLAMRLVPTRLLGRHPLTLAGGEARRVALAKVLGRPADVYLLDEPEAHLDGPGRTALWRLLAMRIEQGACILAASHDAGVAQAAADVVEAPHQAVLATPETPHVRRRPAVEGARTR